MSQEERTVTLADGLVSELARVRELRDVYVGIGRPGAIGAALLGAVITRAEAAAASGDVVAMIRSFHELQGCTE